MKVKTYVEVEVTDGIAEAEEGAVIAIDIVDK
jgi:hypothetical protein